MYYLSEGVSPLLLMYYTVQTHPFNMALLLRWDVCHILAWQMNHTCVRQTQTLIPSQFEETITLVTHQALKGQDNIRRI